MSTYTKSNFLNSPKIEPFTFIITKGIIDIKPNKGNAPNHIHDHYEIFINISGNIDFIVDDKIYALSNGDVLVISPNKYHHSIYKYAGRNEYYFIFFPKAGNEELFDKLLNPADDKEYLVKLPSSKRNILFKLCEELLNKSGNQGLLYITFFKLLEIINEERISNEGKNEFSPKFEDISRILNYINENYSTISSIEEIAKKFHISIKTLERLFKKHTCDSPKSYIDMLRLSKASEYLRLNHTVTETCYKCGFSDCSRFIRKFKKQFGETPHHYKSRYVNSLNNAYYSQAKPDDN